MEENQILNEIISSQEQAAYPQIWVSGKGRHKVHRTGLCYCDLLQLAHAKKIRYAIPEVKPFKIVFWLPDVMEYLASRTKQETLSDETLDMIANRSTQYSSMGRPKEYFIEDTKEFLMEALKNEAWNYTEIVNILRHQFKCSRNTANRLIKELRRSNYIRKENGKYYLN